MSVVREYKEGRVSDIYDADTGAVVESVTGPIEPTDPRHPFEQRGAQIEFRVGDVVTFLKIGLPNGRVIVKEVGKKK
ncbi:hypothetical protein K6119_06985 [Paracrocinitomix mangrovi]|uniref:hypothetical protein n=1 Tax=Paracrocinitomix mangrovi TaxID=2862509 RepID=UPI001C8EE4F0|nr:hypothetical protein [Paracrocinitomix mangrovi]UKN03258.1 hypothetical protein K6119_06985 [Paracrocinitomix mangrovi]